MMISSIWHDLPPLPTPSLSSLPQRAKIIVIGAGLTGLSVAYHLLAHQQEVIVLEAGEVGAGASMRSTGMLTPGIAQSLTTLIRHVGHDAARHWYKHSLQAIHTVVELLEREHLDCQLHLGGQLIVAQGPSGRKRLATQAQAFAQLDLPCQPLDHTGLARHLQLGASPPGPAHLPAALFLPLAGVLHPGRLVHGLAQCVQKRGGIIYSHSLVTHVSSQRPATLILATGQHIIADHVILATGGYTPQLGLLQSRILPVQLQALVTEPLSKDLLHQLGWSSREGVTDSRRLFNYFRLTADNRLVFGGGRPVYQQATSSLPDFTALVQALHRTFPADFHLSVAKTWTGLIDYVLDTLPFIGRLDTHPAVIQVGGWCGHGIALSIAAGHWVAHLLEHGHFPPTLPPLRKYPPRLPTEGLRRAGFWIGTKAMAWLDRTTL